MYKKGTGNDKQRKDEGNRTLCLYRNFSQAIITYTHILMALEQDIVSHQFRGFLPVTLEVIKVHSRTLVAFPKV